MDTSARQHEEILAALSDDARARQLPPDTASRKSTYRLLGWLENPSFYGRQDELEAMARELLDLTDQQLRIFSLIGMAGVGKSQIALRFAYLHRDGFDGVFWIPADEPTKLAQGYADIAKEAGLTDDASSASEDTVRQTVVNWFKTTS